MARSRHRARRNSPLYLPSAFDLFTPSKELVLKNVWIFGPLYAIPLIFGIRDWIWSPGPAQGAQHWWSHAHTFNGAWAGSPLPSYDSSILVGFSVLWLLVVLVVGSLAAMMAQAAQLDAAEDRRLDFQDLWRTVKKIWLRLFGLYIVIAVIVVVGLFLLVIPGLIFIRRYYLAPYVMLDKNVSISEALRKSADLTKLNTSAVWGVIGVTFLIALVSIIPFIGGLISFALGCLYSVAPALRYQQLKKLA